MMLVNFSSFYWNLRVFIFVLNAPCSCFLIFNIELNEVIKYDYVGNSDILLPKIGSDHQTRNGNWQVPMDTQELKATPVPSCVTIERQC